MEHYTNSLDIIREELNNIRDHDTNSFTFDLPKSQFDKNSNLPNLNDLTKAPNFNECPRLAVDENGDNKYLNQTQLENLRKDGTFAIPSEDFPNQDHVWKVNSALQLGTENNKEGLFNTLSTGCYQFIVAIPDRLYDGAYCNVVDGFYHLVKSIKNMVAALIGLSTERDLYRKQEIQNKLLEFTESKFIESILSSTDIIESSFTIQLPNNQTINLILDKREIIIKALSEPYKNFMIYWNKTKFERRKKLLSKNSISNIDDNVLDILENNENNIKNIDESHIESILKEEQTAYQKELFNLINNHLNNEDASALINLIDSILIFRDELKLHQENKAHALQLYTELLKKEHYIMSRHNDWMQRKIKQFNEDWDRSNPVEDVYKIIGDKLTGQAKYIFASNQFIRKSNEYKVEEDMLNNTQTNDSSTFSFRIWNPANWIITQGEKSYTVEKYNTFELNNTYPGWKLVNTCINTAQYLWNGCFYLIVNLYQGQFGLRSLYGLDKFNTDVNFDNTTGTLTPNMVNLTWFGRIKRLWKNITKSIEDFENAPDDGIFGKAFSRILNRFWNYIVCGAFGTLLCFIGHPILVLLNTLVSTLGLVASPLWAPLFAFARYLCQVFIYDFDSSKNSVAPLPKVFWKFFIKGLGQILVSLGGVITHGLIGGIVCSWGLFSYSARHIYDASMYHIILKNLAKIPRTDVDGWFLSVRRISGPGLSMQYFQIVDYNFVLYTLLQYLEKLENDAYLIEIEHVINKPLNNLLNYYSQFKEVGMTHNSTRVNTFKDTQKELTTYLHKLIDNNKMHYMENKSMIRMSYNDLLIAMERGSELVRQFTQKNIFPRLTDREEIQFWSSKNVIQNDWIGLTKHCYCTIFNDSIMIPLEETDIKGFHLKVSEISIQNFIKDLFNGVPQQGIDFNIMSPIMIDKLSNLPSNEFSVNDAFYYNDKRMFTITYNNIIKYKKRKNEKITTINDSKSYGTFEMV